jgi:hypothetical protein
VVLMAYLAAHPYLLTTLLLAGAAGLAVLLLPQQRAMLLCSGGLAMPLGFFAYQHTPWYWVPQRTSSFVPAVEDFLFLAAWGVLAWFLAVLPVANRLTVQPQWRRLLLLYLPGVLVAVATTEFLRQVVFGLAGVMYVHVLLFGLFAGYSLWQRPDLWVLSVSGGLLSGLFYLVFLRGFLVWHPAYLDTLNPAALWPWNVWGVPASELAWPAAFGASWPMFLAYAWQARLRERPQLSGRPWSTESLRPV